MRSEYAYSSSIAATTRVAAAARDELREPTLREPVRGQLCAKVAAALVRVPRVREEEREHLVRERQRRASTSPSWNSSRDSAGRLAGSMPPTSAWCARETA